jgi:hypothetical protein
MSGAAFSRCAPTLARWTSRGCFAALSSVWIVAAMLALTTNARAHQILPAVLALREVAAGRFAVHWSPPSDGTRVMTELHPTFPEHCRAEGESVVDCGARGLVGSIRFEGGPVRSGVSVDIEWLGGTRELRVATGDPARLSVSGTPLRASPGELLGIAASYGTMGFEHILTGVDHLMFVAGLLLFVTSVRQLLLTITSFTLAHSVTLAAAALNLVHPPRAPVELCIALSILLLAVEASRTRETWTHRAPWLVAFVFGLLHGFGFASALVDVGLPPAHVPLALASFNVGVEAGQLVAVAVVVGAYRLFVRGARAAARTRTAAVYVLGTASVYWCLDRAMGMWSALRG